MGRSGLWTISWLQHQMFYPYATTSATQAHESDNLRHAMSLFSLFLSFSGAQRISGYVRPQRIVAVHPPKTVKPHFWAAFGGAVRLGQPLRGVVTKVAFKCNVAAGPREFRREGNL